MSTTSTRKAWVFRREGIPNGTTKDALRQSFPPEIRDQIEVTSLSPGINLNERTLTATFSLNARTGDELLLSEDKDFYGFTPLYSPEGEAEADIIAITGLAGHAFGSWAAPPHMWLRDFLPNDLPTTRVLLYGYDSKLAGSQSKNILSDLSNNFVVKFHTMRSLSRSEHRPIILIGHSLGCLIIKDALIEMKSHPDHHLCECSSLIWELLLYNRCKPANYSLSSTITTKLEGCHFFWRSTSRVECHCHAVHHERHAFRRTCSGTRVAIPDHAEAQ